MDVQSGQQLSITRLAEVIKAPESTKGILPKESVGSQASNVTPGGLEADLTHYKELFRKLRFSYISQVTKERFLRAILSSPPHFASPEENAQLETATLALKADLQSQKAAVAAQIGELEASSRDLARRNLYLDRTIVASQDIPQAIAAIELAIAEMQDEAARYVTAGGRLPLKELLQATTSEITQDVLAERRLTSEELDGQISSLKAVVDARNAEVQRLEIELRPIAAQKVKAAQLAEEAASTQRPSGATDESEERGKWLHHAHTALQNVFGGDTEKAL